ncbi:DUF4276 family protein [Cellulosimicrobium composti]|uniref:DUF4276 family protein n=1 Tax=Cellulosimicrobium composti TaxID=2672572 RepID=A0ABX0BAF0_9MICO|nr:DUF4276 family protein [Cellulosimicrobium composti]NDO89564.1 DUF4276 family protein [Cellulosimicrobium composti]
MSGAIVIASVVEGHGEVTGLPVLLRRIAFERHNIHVDVLKPHRVPRANMVRRPDELQKAVRLQANRVRGAGAVIVLTDSDDDDPEKLRARLQATVDGANTSAPAVVSVAVREYEAWFLAGIESLRVHPSVLDDATYEDDCEAPRNPKLRLEMLMTESYGSVRHQVAFNARLDLDEVASKSPSFRQFLDAVAAVVDPGCEAAQG